MANTTLTAPPLAMNAGGSSFWNDETTDLHDTKLRKSIPEMPQISQPFQTVRGKSNVLIYLIFQILRSRDKPVIMRAIASAMSCIFEDAVNYTGSQAACVLLTGLEKVVDETITDKSTVLTTNFEDAEAVSIADMEALLAADEDELAAYFGVLCLAGVKRLTPENRSAFNERRANAVRAQSIEDLKIFTQNSIYLDDQLLDRVYAAFSSYGALKCHMMAKCAAKMGTVTYGPQSAFSVMFMLLVDNGMGALRIIKEAVLKYPWVRIEFPELKPEMALANNAQQVIKRAATAQRPFLKAIYGSSFVPLPYQETANLVGICRELLLDTTPTYRNYRGGKTTPAQEEKLKMLLMRYGGARQVTPTEDSVE